MSMGEIQPLAGQISTISLQGIGGKGRVAARSWLLGHEIVAPGAIVKVLIQRES